MVVKTDVLNELPRIGKVVARLRSLGNGREAGEGLRARGGGSADTIPRGL